MSTGIRTFEDLECWKACRELRTFAVGIARALPKEELYRLTDQVVRAARSTTANIAEGYGRYHYQENAQFCRQARGSLYETLDHFIAGNDDGLIGDTALQQFRALFESAVRLLNGYINYLANAARNSKSAGRSVREESESYGDRRECGIVSSETGTDPDQLTINSQGR